MVKYIIFGLNVLSEIELNCYPRDFIEPEVKIVISQDKKKSIRSDRFIELNEKLCVFQIANVGEFSISNGNLIEVIQAENADKRMIETFILGTSFGAIMQQRKEFPLHGSVVTNGDITLAFVGESGAGKTSIATSYAQLGYEIITDDVIRVELKENEIYVNASYPSQKIWMETARHLGLDIDISKKIHNRFDKYYYSNNNFFFGKQKLDFVFEIIKCDIEDVLVDKYNIRDTFGMLIRNTYRRNIIVSSKLSKEHFSFMGELTNNLIAYRIRRPINGFTTANQIDLIQKLII